jgi:nitrate reductase gamma subunit
VSFDLNFFLFGILPYISLAILLLGSAVRFDRDPYSWRSKSSQILRKRQLMWGSVLFHVGILIVLGGHVVGLLTPIAIFDFFGISHGFKQILAMSVGGVAGAFCLVGLLMLLHRRLFDRRIRVNSSFADIAVLVLLLAQLLLGLCTITVSMKNLDGHEMVKFMEWAQHIVTFRVGAADYVRDVPLVFKLHLTLGMFIFMIFPFTRLVHIWSAPVFYVLRRQYQIVRRREV